MCVIDIGKNVTEHKGIDIFYVVIFMTIVMAYFSLVFLILCVYCPESLTLSL